MHTPSNEPSDSHFSLDVQHLNNSWKLSHVDLLTLGTTLNTRLDCFYLLDSLYICDWKKGTFKDVWLAQQWEGLLYIRNMLAHANSTHPRSADFAEDLRAFLALLVEDAKTPEKLREVKEFIAALHISSRGIQSLLGLRQKEEEVKTALKWPSPETSYTIAKFLLELDNFACDKRYFEAAKRYAEQALREVEEKKAALTHEESTPENVGYLLQLQLGAQLLLSYIDFSDHTRPEELRLQRLQPLYEALVSLSETTGDIETGLQEKLYKIGCSLARGLHRLGIPCTFLERFGREHALLKEGKEAIAYMDEVMRSANDHHRELVSLARKVLRLDSGTHPA